jgi:carboxymethylenebutenolidase
VTINGARVELGDGGLGYAVLPDGATRGAVVLHEILGPRPEIERVVDRFAAAGYAAVAPDLWGDRARVVCIWRAMHAMRSGRGPQIDAIVGARGWLCQAAQLRPEHVGLIGFCIGGGFALAAGRGWGAVSTNYGNVPPLPVLDGSAPVIGCYGGRDRIFGRAAKKLERRMRPLGVECETHTFDDVGHSFLTDGNYGVLGWLAQPLFRIDYNPAIADEAWRRIFAFFDRHL